MADTQHNHQRWEDQWQQAFEGAETPPAAHVWKNIEGELAVQESGRYRRGYQRYRAVAAVLLLLIAGLSWYILTQPPSADAVVDLEDTILNSTPSTQAPTASVPALPSAGSDVPAERPDQEQSSPNPAAPSARLAETTNEQRTRVQSHTREVADATTSAASPSALPKGMSASDSFAQATPALPAGSRPLNYDARSALPSVNRIASGAVADASPARLPSQSETVLYRVPQVPASSTKEDRKPIALFAGVSLAPGYFDPQFQATPSEFGVVAMSPGASPSPNTFEMANVDAYNPPSETVGIENTPELSFTYGFDFGMHLSEHWVLESGVDYNRFSTSTDTRWVVADVASGQRYAFVATNVNTLSSNLNRAPNTTTALNNDYEFVAVPLKVGYRLSVHRFQFTLSSGLAANFFLGNNISAAAASSELSTYRISASKSGSPFNDVYYSGLMSGGVNYNVLGRYYLSLTPTYSFALTPLTRVDSNLDSNPYSFGLNVGFQYQF